MVYFKMSPELGDGVNYQVTDSQGVLDYVKEWIVEAKSDVVF